MIDKKDIFNLGIGTWKIDIENIEKDIQALIHSNNLGQNYLSLSMLYNIYVADRQFQASGKYKSYGT